MINKQVVLTSEGLKKLEDELDNLKSVKRREISARIKQALSFGDISENSEYDEAKNEQAQIETRITTVENMLKYAQVIDESEIRTDAVSIGAKVVLYDLEFEEEVTYHIVGSTEASPDSFKISNESPVGKALIGKQKGDIIDVEVPAGTIQFKVIEISK